MTLTWYEASHLIILLILSSLHESFKISTVQTTLSHIIFLALMPQADHRELRPQPRSAADSDGLVGYHGCPASDVKRPAKHLSQSQRTTAEQTHHCHQPGPSGQARLSYIKGKASQPTLVSICFITVSVCELKYIYCLFTG